MHVVELITPSSTPLLPFANMRLLYVATALLVTHLVSVTSLS